MDGIFQVRYNTGLTVEDYVSRQAWWDASPPDCPYHRRGGCRLAPHGSYARKTPAGVRVRRFLCPQTRRTVSLLPDGLAAHLPGTLAEVERVVRTVGRAGSVERAADQLRSDPVTLPTAMRWVRLRVRCVQAFLATCITLYPERFGQLEPSLEAFGAAFGSEAVLETLRAVTADRLASLPAPVGFLRRNCAPPAKLSRRQHANGLDPPAAAA